MSLDMSLLSFRSRALVEALEKSHRPPLVYSRIERRAGRLPCCPRMHTLAGGRRCSGEGDDCVRFSKNPSNLIPTRTSPPRVGPAFVIVPAV